MAKTPINDPNHPRTTDPYATDRPAETEKKSKVLPIVIGLIVLAILAYFLLGMMSSDDEVETTDPAAQTQMDDTATTPSPVVVDTVDPEPEAAPVTAPDVDTEADAAPAGVTEESVTVEIVDPDETTAPIEGTETTTVPLQSPEPAPAN
ncbi:hypothetical protein E4191_15915 (plasmid) [Paracoccus liaowanqingii]|uniref:Uncharacterized protein n=1 Tax=Paracoccus liaowanqingii TaxID=2560053 RepID=A0A4Y5SQ85_9RHOB|nr:hypothetical protein [Paracoccus liaowanqingii]QDA35660.1 hypothetical protein E4191_15915 [Paracoccus liaowanqingii]